MAVDDRHRIESAALGPPPRLLLGPGPSNAHPRVLEALSTPQVGHLDSYFIGLMDEIQELLRYGFQTSNQLTVPISGTGSAGMEACVANLVEPGDRVVVGCNGYFGGRIAEMASRQGGVVTRLTRPWGEVFERDELAASLAEHRPAVLGLVHAETSTGACQPLDGVAELCREHDCLLIADTVTSLGGLPVRVDEWGIDAAYSGTQKCLSCPPGLGPVTFGPRAVEKLTGRGTPVTSWYLDLSLLVAYWGGGQRTYHHTAPISMNYALREALRLVAEEGLDRRWRRHRETAEALWSGLEAMGLDCHVAVEHRLPSLTTIGVPAGIDAGRVVKTLLTEHGIEIGGGLGELAGRVWRVGLMGYNSRRENVDRLLDALSQVL
jgi:alanine-glyoxylate transaminase/serine-glyoxylate transaminase/serine-pyruvate transaminase